MHVWVTEIKRSKDSKWEAADVRFSRENAKADARYYRSRDYYNVRVVKYISTKGA